MFAPCTGQLYPFTSSLSPYNIFVFDTERFIETTMEWSPKLPSADIPTVPRHTDRPRQHNRPFRRSADNGLTPISFCRRSAFESPSMQSVSLNIKQIKLESIENSESKTLNLRRFKAVSVQNEPWRRVQDTSGALTFQTRLPSLTGSTYPAAVDSPTRTRFFRCREGGSYVLGSIAACPLCYVFSSRILVFIYDSRPSGRYTRARALSLRARPRWANGHERSPLSWHFPFIFLLLNYPSACKAFVKPYLIIRHRFKVYQIVTIDIPSPGMQCAKISKRLTTFSVLWVLLSDPSIHLFHLLLSSRVRRTYSKVKSNIFMITVHKYAGWIQGVV